MINILNFKDFIRENSDYRNVTGNGSSGGNDPQNSGPSFNKGPMSAIYNQPTVIGVEKYNIDDPYFNQKYKKIKKIKKNPNIEKNRKDKSKYLINLDKNIRKKLF